MAALPRTIRKARRRVTADLAIRGAGSGLVFGASAGLVLLVLERAAGLAVWGPAYALVAMAGLLVGAAAALRARPGRFATAVRLDRVLRLKDQLGTAAVVGTGRLRGDFAELAWVRAQRLAESIDVRVATPIRVTRIWGLAAALAGALVLGILFLPAASTATADPAERADRLREQRTQISRTIDEAVADLNDETLDEQSQEDLNTLQELARQLGRPDTPASLAETRAQSLNPTIHMPVTSRTTIPGAVKV